MPIIEHQQFIKASVTVCFDLARNVNIHTQTTLKTREKAVGGVIEGLLLEGDTVTWEAVHFGIKQRLTAKVTKMNKPYEFAVLPEVTLRLADWKSSNFPFLGM